MHIAYVLMICFCISDRLQFTSTVSVDRSRNLFTCPSTTVSLTMPILILFPSATVTVLEKIFFIRTGIQ